MLEMKKKVTYAGRSVIDGMPAAGFQATIDSENPSNISTNNWVIDKSLYKNNHATCIVDQKEFESFVFDVQDKLIAEKAIKEAEV